MSDTTDATSDAASTATEGPSALARVGAFLLEHWRAIGTLLLVGAAAGYGYVRGRRAARAVEVGGYYDGEADDAGDG